MTERDEGIYGVDNIKELEKLKMKNILQNVGDCCRLVIAKM